MHLFTGNSYHVGYLECGCLEQNLSFSLFFINNIFKIVIYFYIILNINIVC